jgi:hypothetical protein
MRAGKEDHAVRRVFYALRPFGPISEKGKTIKIRSGTSSTEIFLLEEEVLACLAVKLVKHVTRFCGNGKTG